MQSNEARRSHWERLGKMWNDSRCSCQVAYQWTSLFLFSLFRRRHHPGANLQPPVIYYKCWREYAKQSGALLSSFYTDKSTFPQYMTERINNHPLLSKFISFLFRGAPVYSQIAPMTSRDPCSAVEVIIPGRLKPSNLVLSYYHAGCNPFIRETIFYSLFW